MSATANEPPEEEIEYRVIRWATSRPLPGYFSVTVNVEEERRKATFRRINRMLRGER